jgi:RNA polymerase sigma-70 factor, ECF subfamily
MNTHNTLDSSGMAFNGVPYDQMQDEDLMCAIQSRDPLALTTLLQRYRSLLQSVILRIVHDHAAADDVMQESFVEIWRRADHYSPAKGRPLGWMVTLAKRRAIDQLRRHMAYSIARDRMEKEAEVFAANRVQDEASACERADMGALLRQQLSRLPEPQQEVICLAFLKGMSQREVARATHTPLGTVKTRMELGLKKLRAGFRDRNASCCRSRDSHGISALLINVASGRMPAGAPT